MRTKDLHLYLQGMSLLCYYYINPHILINSLVQVLRLLLLITKQLHCFYANQAAYIFTIFNLYLKISLILGLLWFEHNFSSTQIRRLTNLALTRTYKKNREYPIRTDVVFTPNKFQAYRHKPLSQFSYTIYYLVKKKRVDSSMTWTSNILLSKVHFTN